MSEEARLLSWLNELLDLRYTSLAECADCTAYGQILCALHPECASHDLRFLVMDHLDERANYKLVTGLIETVIAPV